MTRKKAIAAFSAIAVVAALLFYLYGRSIWMPVLKKFTGKRTVAEAVSLYGDSARSRLKPYFEQAGVAYPPDRVVMLGIKGSATLELWVEGEDGPKHIRNYAVQAQSGTDGPKLREGDRQVPEGLYAIEGLNPNSAYHLSMKLNYPNPFDLLHAKKEGRDNPGSNIFIHGKAVSIGCLAMGDSAIEELFVLAADVGISNVQVAIAPSDPRIEPLSAEGLPSWVEELYGNLNEYFSRFSQQDN